jgi:nucleoid-associated protein YgaU
MKNRQIITIFALLLFGSCSQNVKKEQASDSGMETISPEDEALFASTDDEVTKNIVTEKVETQVAEVEAQAETAINEYAEYEVKAGDTLMLVAYKVLGDYQKWQEISKLNKDVLGKKTVLEQGQKLRYIKREIASVENPQGSPYLIKPSDNLGVISKKVYNTSRLWDELYYNNRKLIKNPNVLYSGFVIFYPSKDEIPQIQVAMVNEKFDAFSKSRLPASVKKK